MLIKWLKDGMCNKFGIFFKIIKDRKFNKMILFRIISRGFWIMLKWSFIFYNGVLCKVGCFRIKIIFNKFYIIKKNSEKGWFFDIKR